VTLEILPPNEKKITAGGFNAALQLMSPISRHGRQDGLSLLEHLFELGGSIGNDVEDCDFEYHEITSIVKIGGFEIGAEKSFALRRTVLAGLLGTVAHGFDVVAVGIGQEPAIVFRMIDRPETGCAEILASRRQTGAMKLGD
jgi:hypothetical protein